MKNQSGNILGNFSGFPVFSGLFIENIKLLLILAKVGKILKIGLLRFTISFSCRIRLNKEKK